jgi:Cdc6-like AAA superfamily ATPase
VTGYDLGDKPLEEPSQDLLEMAPFAETLAGVLAGVQLPVTIGIYGEWGEGKTTLAHLLVHYLRKRSDWDNLQFINFSTWPYVTADAIWRALLDQIARHVYGQSDMSEDKPSETTDPTIHGNIRRYLRTGVLTLRAKPVNPRKQRYEQLRMRFDRSAALANRTMGDSAGANLSALAGLVLDAAATVSPVIGPLKRIFEPKESAIRSILPGERPAAPEVVASVEELRQDLRDLFRDSAQDGAKLVILLDDLDRCLPQVALDFLETIKVFFFESVDVEAPFLFLVAVDENLVGRGLQMRIGAAPGVDSGHEARMYLEKIVQFGMPVPSPSEKQVHHLISASFPEWAQSADLIAVGLGRNPRRIKQQCNLMAYGYKAREAIVGQG